MSNTTLPEHLVKSRLAKWKIKNARLTLREKLSKWLIVISTILALLFVTTVVLNIIDFFSYDTVTATVISPEKEFKDGKEIGYRHTYLVSYGSTTTAILSNQVVGTMHSAGTHIKLYVKEEGGSLIVSETYRTNTVLLVLTITSATLLASSCIASVVLNRKDIRSSLYGDKPIDSNSVENDTVADLESDTTPSAEAELSDSTTVESNNIDTDSTSAKEDSSSDVTLDK